MSQSTRTPQVVDMHVGHQIRVARLALNITQQELAARCGITFQQIQKYENATNRVSASRLWQIAQALEKPMIWFFPQPAPAQRARKKA